MNLEVRERSEKMYLSILKKDLKRKKAMNMILLLFIILATMFVSSSVNNIINVTTALDNYFEMANAPDYFVATMNKNLSVDIDETVGSASAVDRYAVENILFLSSDNFIFGDEDIVINGGTNLVQSDIGMNYFLSDGSILETVKPGEFYMTEGKADALGVDVGDRLTIELNGVSREFVLADKIKDDSKKTIEILKENNIKKTVMLTGDKKQVGEHVADILGLDEVYTELLPDGKVKKVEELLKQKSEKGKLVFVGDGINDAPVLALADIGIAMGGLGSDAAIEAADVVIMTDEPSKIGNAIQISKKTMRIVRENIIFSLVVKIAVLILTACGLSTMWEAVFADVGVSIIAILNSLRVLRNK